MIWLILAAVVVLLAFGGKAAMQLSGNISPKEIATYASNAGFHGVDLITAVAIALAESGGKIDARGDERVKGDPSTATSYGLWQIHWTVHPELYSNSPSELFDPQNNACAAFQLYSKRGNSFKDWSTYTVADKNNVLPYTKHLTAAEEAVSV